jgi:hypothetical protein
MRLQHLLIIFLSVIGLKANAQVIQSAQPLELKKSTYYHTALAAPDANYSQLVTFVADKEKITAFRYNSVLYFTDSLSTKRPDTDYDLMAGYSYDADRQVTVYWVEDTYTKIQPVSFNFETKAVVTGTPIALSLREENIITAFSDNNSFYLITLPRNNKEEDVLRLYTFSNGRLETHSVDFSGIDLRSISNKEITLNDMLEAYPLQKIDTRAYNGLTSTSSKLKFYISNGEMTFTLDHNAAYTQVLTLNLNTYSLTEKRIPHPQLQTTGEGNSYLHEGRLYQLKANKDQLALAATDMATGELIKSYAAKSNDSIGFKNSDLVSQTGSGRPKIFKDTKKFLQRLEASTIALSVYQTPDDILVTAGGVRNVIPAGSAILGAALIAAGGSDALMGEFFDPESQQLNYFEGTFDENFEHRPFRPGMLAVDYLSGFMAANERNMQLVSVFPFGYDVVLGYYDAKAKQYVVRKFTDDDL